jgi:hypothetical protein
MTVTEALIACTLTAGTRFDMTRQARSRINVQYGEWGEPAGTLPDYCSNSWNECDRWLETTMFWPSIEGVGMVLFDCEHWSEREIDRMVRDGQNKGRCKNYVTAFTLCAFNGVMLTIRVNWNGKKCEGRKIPPKIIKILEDHQIRKQMFGIGGDVTALEWLDITVINWADTSRLMVATDTQPNKQDPKSGKNHAAEWHRCPVAFHYGPHRVEHSTRVDHGGYKFERKFKHWTANMELYNFYDVYVAWATIIRIAAETALTRGHHEDSDIVPWIHFWHDLHREKGTHTNHTHRPTHEWVGTRPSLEEPYPGIPTLTGDFKIMTNTLASTTRYRRANPRQYAFDTAALPEGVMIEYEAVNGPASSWINGNQSGGFLKPGKAWPHVCKKCGNFNHTEDECTNKNTVCLYSVCRSSSHNIDFCPVLATQCKWCDAHGHGPDDHKNFLGPELRVQYLAGRPLSAMASKTINKDITYTVIDAGVEPGLQLKAE